ncbi:hypothetical protein [Leptolyngbya sp. FACHB-711]|uniref:hypothetical protein n=1 Tax=unclassified Leptolyngbya TaxID=2650499 RepID=UPI00168359C6|nr:hypothetical protein [Leptolyngbya sp. FACHB-711]MBD1848892.1 hypothetical protein [Cyanobacteria bacterium FACHB-502]MBD2026006.1 hypothetical protein [Leptolyngbya sp. FACHB-711]
MIWIGDELFPISSGAIGLQPISLTHPIVSPAAPVKRHWRLFNQSLTANNP